ncbi:hypothetical protein DFP94_12028 [Fontibacillus phaseoli]|uniref:Uncharacterized protein n=1 Tax=Fontibacillus phaseoli TaxID=1416533 RepID=A0A369AWP7_9BACL|nr:hypothetical protein [Fontibacillus phaseoli]RCX13581.1 hypothetical protein DFP94_12028 [Fontibacillus phaseoli]
MNYELIQDACHLLQSELSPETGIRVTISDQDVRPFIFLLEQYDMPAIRRLRLLSIYIAIKLALQRHGDCESSDSGEVLTRKVLDGDYLYSFYLQLCLGWQEIDLLIHLAPVIKQIQIKRASGKSEDERLLKGWELFLQLENNPSRQSRAI